MHKPYTLVGTRLGNATVIGYEVKNKYKRYTLLCSCGVAFHRNTNKLVVAGKVLKPNYCPVCRQSVDVKSGREMLLSIYKRSYIHQKWTEFVKAAYAKSAVSRRVVELPAQFLDFFQFLKTFGDKREKGFVLRLKAGSSILNPRNLQWVPDEIGHKVRNV